MNARGQLRNIDPDRVTDPLTALRWGCDFHDCSQLQIGEDLGIWTEFGPTRFSFLEYLLIGIASSIFPRELLNREGHSRR
jgi:hypothetical protein